MLKKSFGTVLTSLVMAAGLFTGCSDSLSVAAEDASFGARAVEFARSGDRIYAVVDSSTTDRIQFKLKLKEELASGTVITFYTTYNCNNIFPDKTKFYVRDGVSPYTKWTTDLGEFIKDTGDSERDGWYPVTVTTSTKTKEIGFTYTGNFVKGSVVAIKYINVAQSFSSDDLSKFETTTDLRLLKSKPDEFRVKPTAGNSGDNPSTGSFPTIKYETTYTLSGLNELSGICLSFNKEYLWGVDDNGGLYRIKFDGSFSRKWNYKDEMEGLAVDPDTGDLYIGLESSERNGWRLYYNEDYEYGYNFDSSSGRKQIDAFTSSHDNSGIEGIAWYDGDLYFGTQTDARLYHCTKDGKVISDRSLKNSSAANGETNDIKEIAGLDYDKDNDWLWVLDSERFKIYIFTGDGKTLLKSYNIKSSHCESNPEGICIDKKRGYIWISEDNSNTSLLHKFKISNYQ
ncbi:MAG: SdiA-regulated domain-containing protein [Treponema sp.]|nr:SdiA-regulated domain-containing protein [Treponema sp.]